MLQDLRFVLRSLARSRGFTAVTVLTLALGIGSAAAIFSVTDWIVFRAPKHLPNVYLIGGKSDQSPFLPIRYDFMARAYQDQTDVMSAYAKGTYQSGNVVVDGQPVATGWMAISANLFPMLDIRPALGRGFHQATDSDQVVIVSHQFWQRQLGGKMEALGGQITVGKDICTLIGVLAEGQLIPAYLNNDVYRPLVFAPDVAQPWLPELFLLGQLRLGLTREQAEMALVNAKPAIPATMQDYLIRDRPVLSSIDEMNQTYRPDMYGAMLGAVGFLYAIACLNASNLMLVRTLGQRRELSTRLALGAARWRVIRQLGLECVLLAVFASLAGLVVANWLFPLLMNSVGSAPADTITLNGRFIGLLALLAIASSAFTAIVPAVTILRTDIYAGLKDGGGAQGESPALARLRGVFVILQSAFAVILLVGAGLMIQTFQNLRKVDLGFDPMERAKIQISFPSDYPVDGTARVARLNEIQAELLRLPGVHDAGFANDILLPGFYNGTNDIECRDGKPLRVCTMGLGSSFEHAAGLRLKAGSWTDLKSTGNEVMISEAVARALWPGQNPANAVGQLLRPIAQNADAANASKGWLVVGVVGDVRTSLRGSPGLFVYAPESWGLMNMNTFVVSLSRECDAAWAGMVRQALYRFDSRLVVSQIAPLSEYQDNEVWAEKLADAVLKILAGIALLLAVVGVFSVLAYTVDRRMGEFGVRMALGATPRDLFRLVLNRGLKLTLAGIAAGLAGALALGRFIKALLFETLTSDPWVLGGVALLLIAAAASACLLPARRATRADVSKLLRSG